MNLRNSSVSLLLSWDLLGIVITYTSLSLFMMLREMWVMLLP